jgi:lipoprotein-anchoring transpeptidase ErfK/SrfK
MSYFHKLFPAVLRAALLLSLIAAGGFGLSGCGTVSDLVITNIPDYRKGKVSIVVRLREQQAYLYKAKTQVASSRISPGREGHRTPVGKFRVTRKDPDHRSSVYGYYADESGRPVKENIDIRKGAKPPGSHFVGASMPFFLEFSPGYGLHQGYLPGYPASHGCVRMPYWKARQFYDAARIGTPVTVKP